MTGTWYIQRGRSDPLGPFTTDEVLEGLTQGEIPGDSLVRELAGTAWLPFAAVPEFREAFARASTRDDRDAHRLAPKDGPAWRSSAERHVGRGAREAPPSAEPVRSAARPRPRSDARPDAIASSNLTVGGLIAALGIVWAFVRLGGLVSPPVGWIPIVDQFHAVRDGSIADLALAAVAYPLLFLGIFGVQTRARFGLPVVRGVARVVCVGNVVIAAVTLARLHRSVRLAEAGSVVTLVAVVAATPLLLAACAVSLFWLFPARDVHAGSEAQGWSEMLISALVTAGVLGASLALFGTLVDVVHLADDGAAFVYTDTIGLRLCFEGRREGVAGSFKLDDSRRRGFSLEAPTRGRFIEDFALEVSGGGGAASGGEGPRVEIGREVELLDGPRKGTHVYLPPEEARVR